MAGEPTITIIGNLTAAPELNFTPSGAAVANFTVASTPRTYNRDTNQWDDGEALFMRCAVWRDTAENVAESLDKGTRVIVSGYLKARTYQTKEGENRTVMELDVQEVGPSLRFDSPGRQDPARRHPPTAGRRVGRPHPAAAPTAQRRGAAVEPRHRHRRVGQHQP